MYDLGVARVQEITAQAMRALRMCGQNRPPVNTKEILKRWAIREIDEELQDAEAIFDMQQRPPTLYVNRNHQEQNSPAYGLRVRFTQAHELGHFVLHTELNTVFRESHKRRREAAARGDDLCDLENEADVFAASLLMPPEWFNRDLEHISSLGPLWRDDLCKKYQVSSSSLYRRIAWLRPGKVISGEAFTDSRKIDWAFPTAELERTMPSIARNVWHANDLVRNFRFCHLPVGAVASLDRKDPISRLTSVVKLNEVFPTCSRNVDCELEVDRLTEKRVFFQITLDM